MSEVGHVPIPPYLRRESQASDQDRYQTVFAAQSGAVAAPTAGLHFTPGLLDELRAIGVSIRFITLHVGIGTFRNLREEDLENNRLHSEWYSIPSETLVAILECKRNGGAVFACGTTVTRTLESACIQFPTSFVTDEDNPLNLRDILSISSYTNIFIREGFTFQVVDGLLTNFHLPKSSLLMLVSTFAGREKVLEAYRHASSDYRFFSYGDAMLITPPRWFMSQLIFIQAQAGAAEQEHGIDSWHHSVSCLYASGTYGTVRRCSQDIKEIGAGLILSTPILWVH